MKTAWIVRNSKTKIASGVYFDEMVAINNIKDANEVVERVTIKTQFESWKKQVK